MYEIVIIISNLGVTNSDSKVLGNMSITGDMGY